MAWVSGGDTATESLTKLNVLVHWKFFERKKGQKTKITQELEGLKIVNKKHRTSNGFQNFCSRNH